MSQLNIKIVLRSSAVRKVKTLITVLLGLINYLLFLKSAFFFFLFHCILVYDTVIYFSHSACLNK